MNYYLIDHENAKTAGLVGVKDLTNQDMVILFYTDKSNTLPIEFIEASKNVNINYIKVPTGSESLDKHLIAHVSYLLGTKDKEDKFIIVSRDKGYGPICSYLNELNGGETKVYQTFSIDAYLNLYFEKEDDEDDITIEITPLDEEESNENSEEETDNVEEKEPSKDELEDLKKELEDNFPKPVARGAFSAYKKYKDTKDFNKSIKNIIHKRKNIDSKYKKDITNMLIKFHEQVLESIKEDLPF